MQDFPNFNKFIEEVRANKEKQKAKQTTEVKGNKKKMKYGNEFYMQLSREICSEYYVEKLSLGARMLFVTLNELEQCFCGNNLGFSIAVMSN